jgi:hypothetical protein
MDLLVTGDCRLSPRALKCTVLRCQRPSGRLVFLPPRAERAEGCRSARGAPAPPSSLPSGHVEIRNRQFTTPSRKGPMGEMRQSPVAAPPYLLTPRRGLAIIFIRTHVKGRCLCRFTNTSAESVDAAWKESRNFPTLHSPPVKNAPGNWSASSPHRPSSSKAPVGMPQTTRGTLLLASRVPPAILPREQTRKLRNPASRLNLPSPPLRRTEPGLRRPHSRVGVT